METAHINRKLDAKRICEEKHESTDRLILAPLLEFQVA